MSAEAAILAALFGHVLRRRVETAAARLYTGLWAIWLKSIIITIIPIRTNSNSIGNCLGLMSSKPDCD